MFVRDAEPRGRSALQPSHSSPRPVRHRASRAPPNAIDERNAPFRPASRAARSLAAASAAAAPARSAAGTRRCQPGCRERPRSREDDEDEDVACFHVEPEWPRSTARGASATRHRKRRDDMEEPPARVPSQESGPNSTQAVASRGRSIGWSPRTGLRRIRAVRRRRTGPSPRPALRPGSGRSTAREVEVHCSRRRRPGQRTTEPHESRQPGLRRSN